MKYLLRAFITIFWVVLIFCILYWSKWEVLQYEANSINIFTWGDILDPGVMQSFEKETGIKVNLNYYSSNEELLVKMKATGGAGYDLIIPSDYAVQILSDLGLLKNLDRSKMSFFDELNPLLLGHPFDKENSYSIPFEWEIFGFGIDNNYFRNKPLNKSWKMIFDKDSIDYKIAMINDPIETVLMGAYYLFGPIDQLSLEQTEKVKELLIRQKEWVEAYAGFRGDYFLATKNCPVVVASNSYIWRAKRKFPFIGFVLPKEYSFITIENLSIPKVSKKEKLIYQFINFLYRPESIAAHYEAFGFFPSTINVIPLLNLDADAKELIFMSKEDFKKFYFIKTVLSEQQIRDLWVEIKTSIKFQRE